jgi:serine/threonine-protein kinase
MQHPASTSIGLGAMIGGKYTLEREIGRGGMGLVYAAHHRFLKQTVAVKVLLPQASTDPSMIGRFFNEARASARIGSPHVATVLDVGVTDDGTPFIVMEYLAGEDLASMLARRGALPPAEAVDYALEAIHALAHAHVVGIVHRDVKPANLFLVQTLTGPLLKVLDFGISKVMKGPGDPDASLTKTSGFLGSPLYVAPEQIRSAKKVDARADIWSLGVVLFELLAGRPPFDGDGAGDVLGAVLGDAVPTLRSVCPHVPEGLSSVVARCLERQIDARPRHVVELAEALAPFGSGARAGLMASLRALRPELEARGPAPAPSDPSMTALAAPSAVAEAHARTEVDNRALELPSTREEDTVRRSRVVRLVLAGCAVMVASGIALAGVALLQRRGSSDAPSRGAVTQPVDEARPAEPGSAPLPQPSSPLPPVSSTAPPSRVRAASASKAAATRPPPRPPSTASAGDWITRDRN